MAVFQEDSWTAANRDEFYSLDQGSEIMPLAWIRALKRLNGEPFLSDGLARHGYLPNPASKAGLPIGFTVAGKPGAETFGMTCAACHTRQIEVGGRSYRIDGGPALADFQSLLVDLQFAVNAVLVDATVFADFAASVLGGAPKADEEAALRQALEAWHHRYALWMSGVPSDAPWGPGRLDAVAMIFNRLTGLGLGPPPHHVIARNIRRADAPVRSPFLWNAARQDFTQWAGFADNGDPMTALARNLGQVFGVFARFHPEKDPADDLLGFDYLRKNSANFKGLLRLEELTRSIGAPRWPWSLDEALAEQGKRVFADHCQSCHGKETGTPRGGLDTWKTRIIPAAEIRTDARQLHTLQRTAFAGVLEGATVPTLQVFKGPLKHEDLALGILSVSMAGTLTAFQRQAQGAPSGPPSGGDAARAEGHVPRNAKPGYEARVLEGIWAAAPYLHNGSVPTLDDLLKRPEDRPASFKVGPAYDIERIGLAREQRQSDAVLTTTDCREPSSGNSRCGHDYGTDLPDHKKRQLLEYLKKL
ncbi:cytochrome c [Vineibacter terrae]|uniref:Cytochrome c n=1 Tax=Vineibacter terrae TaxID=2586908 RepID=A0A5C8PU25_9HYPH|nr:cytochrome c [Vineibacter terrae]